MTPQSALTHVIAGAQHEWVANSAYDEPIIVSGAEEILKFSRLLIEFSKLCGQEGWEDLRYFFDLPYARNKRPLLLLITRRPGMTLTNVSAHDLMVAVLVHEYVVKGWPTGIYMTDDFSARRNVIAPPELRGEVAQLASQILVEKGATFVYIAYSDPAKTSVVPVRHGLSYKNQRREVFLYLHLMKTVDETLATMGKRTRNHLRYYRRRAERELGCQFVSDAAVTAEEFRQFSGECHFPTSDELLEIRYRALSNSPNSFLYGIRSGDGRWLSMVGGYKTPESVTIYWQMNRAGLREYSLCTVMRSFLIEHEIASGKKRLSLEGGTSHSMQSYFVRDSISDLLVMRRSLYAELVLLLAKTNIFKKNYFAQLLNDQKLRWQNR